MVAKTVQELLDDIRFLGDEQYSLGHLEGSGKGRRHNTLHSATDIKANNLAHYLPLAREAAKRGS